MQVFAHRGASGEYPENTILACEQAIEQQVHGIEFDVQQALDGLIITHDRMINSEQGKLWVAQQTLSTLQKIALPQQQFPPTLRQLMQCFNGRCLANVELKTISNLDLVKKELEIALNQFNFNPKQIIVSSFDHHMLNTVKTWDLNVEIAALTASLPIDNAAFASNLGADAVHIDINVVNKSFVKDAHNRGLKVRVYTVDEPQDIIKLADWNVDGIFSNFPNKALEVIKTHSI